MKTVLPRSYPGWPSQDVQLKYYAAVKSMDWDAVKKDLKDLMTDSKGVYPADYGHYGGFFIRMAWHATGTYRMSDGRGGADGGCQRFEPELSWEDNGNLAHAHKLVQPIKLKYGIGLSWGDLMVLAGNVAIESMGGPVLGYAAGRMDNIDNSQTISLGPSPEQDKFCPVGTNGDMKFPLGANTMGLIYVNPEGPVGSDGRPTPDPQKAADSIREVFGRMGMDDRENVALIGGGHSVGKAHGAHKEGPGDPPLKCPFNPYPGRPGGGRGDDTSTSGLEGPWTTNPVKFDNEYFKNLLEWDWEKYEGPGGAWQWRVKGENGPAAPKAHGEGTQDIIMLTTDVALAVDPEYRKYVEEFAKDKDAYFDAFAKVWYKLTNRDMGPYSRMVGPYVLPPQDWQNELPPPPNKLADMSKVTDSVKKLLNAQPTLAKDCIRLARGSANTFRHTDYLGGANGARIRFCLDWESHKGLESPLSALDTVKEEFGDSLTWADLIVLAGTVSVNSLGAGDVPFKSGRSDDVDGKAWDILNFTNGKPEKDIEEVMYRNTLRGLNPREYAALIFPDYPSTESLKELLFGPTPTDIDVYSQTLFDPIVRSHVEEFIQAGDDEYRAAFSAAWTTLMNADLFDGPLGAA